MICSSESGTSASFPSRVPGKYRVIFNFKGGITYEYHASLEKEEAEKLVCDVALMHPDTRYFDRKCWMKTVR